MTYVTNIHSAFFILLIIKELYANPGLVSFGEFSAFVGNPDN
jgi:hypothetical protein